MNFAKALKVTDAAARIARIMAALSVVLGKLHNEGAEARVYWLFSISPLTGPHHLAKRVEMVDDASDRYATQPGSLTILDQRNALLAIVDEIREAMERPSTGQRLLDRAPMPSAPRV